MAIKIAAWNVEGRLSQRTTKRRGSPRHILDGIRQLDADVIVLPEAYYKDPATGMDEQLRRLGYQWYDARYDDTNDPSSEADGDRTNVYIRILSRLPIESARISRFGDVRTLGFVTVHDPVSGRRLLVIATHLDDRSEALRLKQAGAIAELVRYEKLPAVMLGDFNAVWDGAAARFLRSGAVRSLATCVPGKWFRSVAMRFTDMASGRVLQFLADRAGVRDADANRQATATPKLHGVEWLPSIRMAQLDHILITGELSASGVTVMPDGGSDHRAITTTIRFKS